jgi:shikimate dehydrogenase
MHYPSGKTHLFFLIADPVAHVRAAQFVNPIFEHRGLDAFLLPVHVRVSDLEDVVPRLAKIGNVKGLIVTIPHKETMARLCDELGPNARMVGAVNAVRIESRGRLVGETFDGHGLIATARTNGIACRGRRILVLGAGGAGRAVAFALAAEGAREIAIHNRTAARANRLITDVTAAFPTVDVRAGAADAHSADLVVNCTSLGLHPGDPLPLEYTTLAPTCDLIDIIAVRETELMHAARAIGCKVVGGRPIVELQLDAQIDFIGRPPKIPVGPMS